jgi:hypothetical protein
MQKQ